MARSADGRSFRVWTLPSVLKERDLSAPGSASAKTHAVDARVAESPLVSLRYFVDTSATDLDELVAGLEREMIALAAERSATVQQLRRNEDIRSHVLKGLSRYAPRDVVRCLHDGLVLTSDLARLDERTADIRRRHTAAMAERDLFRGLAKTLRDVAASGGLTVNERANRLKQASRQIFQIVDDEHEASARAILDGPMQRLSDAAFEAELAIRRLEPDPVAARQHARRCREAAGEAAVGVERLVRRLRPVSADRDLVEALRELLADSPARETARLQVIGLPQRFSPMLEVTAYRVVEAAVDNAVRHGHSSRIDVVLSFQRDRIGLLVKDDGEGFDVFATEARLGRTRGLGLISMHERAALAGSRLEVRSLIGEGTEVRLMLAQRQGVARGV